MIVMVMNHLTTRGGVICVSCQSGRRPEFRRLGRLPSVEPRGGGGRFEAAGGDQLP